MEFHSDKAFILYDHDRDIDKVIIKANKNLKTFLLSGKIKQPLFISWMNISPQHTNVKFYRNATAFQSDEAFNLRDHDCDQDTDKALKLSSKLKKT